jgi:hypothetical protein
MVKFWHLRLKTNTVLQFVLFFVKVTFLPRKTLDCSWTTNCIQVSFTKAELQACYEFHLLQVYIAFTEQKFTADPDWRHVWMNCTNSYISLSVWTWIQIICETFCNIPPRPSTQECCTTEIVPLSQLEIWKDDSEKSKHVCRCREWNSDRNLHRNE